MTILAAALLLQAALQGKDAVDAPGHWPQFFGSCRDNRSRETGLLKEWPEGGPKLLWSSAELGEGFPPVSIAGGRIYGIGYRGEFEYVTSLDGEGRVVWSMAIGPHSGEMPSMRFLSQRSITVDDDRLYAFTAAGVLLSLKTLDGSILWKKLYSDLGSGAWGFFASDAPMVDGKLLICKPGGSKGHVAALDKLTGKVVWQSTELRDRPSHSPLIAAEIAGKRQYLVLTPDHVAGIAAEDGHLLWSAERVGKTAIVATPVFGDGVLFVTSGFGVGSNAFRITEENGVFTGKEIYSGKQLEGHSNGPLLVGDHLYGMDYKQLQCVELKTGTVIWQERCVGKGSLTVADGHLFVRGEGNGTVVLVDASPTGYHETGRFVQPDVSKERALHPIVVGGRLYLRDVKNLHCYDLRGPDYKEPAVVWKSPRNVPVPIKPPPAPDKPRTDAAFVPTPNDVVKRMLELAKVGRNDVVYDLGSGDGRIVITAARDYGCKAVGFEIDPDLLKQSRQEVAKAKVDSLVTIEDKDLFSADLSGATVVTLYLGAQNNARLLPQLRKLKPKSRIVSHQHRLGEAGPEPDERIIIVSKEDPDPHVVYLWNTPLKD